MVPEPNSHDEQEKQGLHHEIGRRLSYWVAQAAAHPFVQLGFLVFCIGWFVLGLRTELLTAVLSILAITLTQMVLNHQHQRDVEDRQRDKALHAKIEELLDASRQERGEAGSSELP